MTTRAELQSEYKALSTRCSEPLEDHILWYIYHLGQPQTKYAIKDNCLSSWERVRYLDSVGWMLYLDSMVHRGLIKRVRAGLNENLLPLYAYGPISWEGYSA